MFSKNRINFQQDNISSIFLTTALAMIFTEITGVIAILTDGIISSQFLGVELYAGISLLRPFARILLVLAGFLSNGCTAVCARLVTQGKRKEANTAFNLTILLALIGSAALILFCLLFPTTTLRLCGVPLTRSPDLIPYMYEYLHGYLIGIVPLLLIQVIGPILVMDGGKRVFIVSAIVLCITDIIGDLLNVFVFHGGAFGMGAATSIGYIMQMLVLLFSLIFRKGYFHPSFKCFRTSYLKGLFTYGMPTFAKGVCTTLREVLFNYINIIFALSNIAIAARGIQGDLFMLLYCIPTGLGKTMITMAGVYYRANDRRGMQHLYAYALRITFGLSVISGVLVFLTAPLLTRLYTEDPQVAALGVFAIRWMSVGLMFDASIVLHQNYLQGTGSQKASNALIFGERLLLPVIFAFVLGMLFGSRGVLASLAVSRIFLIVASFLVNCIRCHGIPRKWRDIMLLPEAFGGAETDNIYAEIKTMDDVIRESKRAYDFCLEHHVGRRVSTLASLFVEEMAGNVVEHARRTGNNDICVNYRLCAEQGRICLSIMDLGDSFDPKAFYELYHDDAPEKNIGIRMVMNMAEEVLYYNTFSCNNLTIYLKSDPAE